MLSISKSQSLILNKEKPLPARGIICAHPNRTRRIATEYMTDVELHTDYRGFQVYSGKFRGRPLFVANTGIGAPAAAFLIEELIAFGANRILRLGSNDAHFNDFRIKIVRSTTLPVGLCDDYGIDRQLTVSISDSLLTRVCGLARDKSFPIEIASNRHIDGYFAVNFTNVTPLKAFNSQDMETGALYLLANLRKIDCLSLLICYPKHETGGEYQDGGKSKIFEGSSIDFAMEVLFGP